MPYLFQADGFEADVRIGKIDSADPQFSRAEALAAPKKPLKSRPKRKYSDPELCKSQNRKEFTRFQPQVMLIPNELHNWLLFMALKACPEPSQNRTVGLWSRNFENGFQLPQAFPQPSPVFLHPPQPQLPEGLTRPHLRWFPVSQPSAFDPALRYCSERSSCEPSFRESAISQIGER
jgi:hypothetical protein